MYMTLFVKYFNFASFFVYLYAILSVKIDLV